MVKHEVYSARSRPKIRKCLLKIQVNFPVLEVRAPLYMNLFQRGYEFALRWEHRENAKKSCHIWYVKAVVGSHAYYRGSITGTGQQS